VPIGSKNQWINILQPQRLSDGSQGTATVYASCFASVSALAGREVDKAEQIDQEISHLVVIDYLAGLTEDMKVQVGTRIFEIQYIEDITERQLEHRIFCVERGQNA